MRGRSSSGFRSRRPATTNAGSRRGITSRSSTRCGRSSDRPRVAVVGASRRRGSIGGELFRNILAADFEGAAYPVNLKAEPVAGVRAYRSIGEIDAAIDLAVICVPAEQVLDAGESRARP